LSLFDQKVFPYIECEQIAEAQSATHVVIGIKRGTSLQLTISSGLGDAQTENLIQVIK
jgi:hypothetical protein